MYKQDYHVEDGTLFLNLSGEFPKRLLKTLHNVFSPLAEALATYNCNRILIDARNLAVEMNILELMKSGEDLATGLPPGTYIAMVTTSQQYNRFFEDVAVNRGALMQVFTDVAKAKEWLVTKTT